MTSVERLLRDPVFEVIPMRETLQKARSLPSGARVSVTASPARGMDATVELALALHDEGFRVIPHLSARLTKSRAELESIVDRLSRPGIDHAFVVGGDADDPGEFFDASSLLDALEEMGTPFAHVGVAGYPEGHPVIDDARLAEALADKQPHAGYLATQLCFDGDRILEWVRSIRSAGITLPVSLGVSGAVDTVKLMTIGARIGVGQSLRFLRKNRRSVTRMLLPGHTTPDGVVAAVAPEAADLGIDSLHIFTFNAIEPTVKWYEGASAST